MKGGVEGSDALSSPSAKNDREDRIVSSARPLRSLYVQVLLGMVLGVTVGHLCRKRARAQAGERRIHRAGADDDRTDRLLHDRLGHHVARERHDHWTHDLKALSLFYFLTALALVLGLATAFVIRPGAGMHIDVHHLDTSILSQYVKRSQPHGLVEFALGVIPETMLGAFEKGEVLPVLLLALLFGFALNCAPRAGRPVLELIDGIAQALFRVLALVMRLAPIGAFGAMASRGRFGIRSIGSLGMLMVSFYVACVLFVVLVLAPLARLHGFALWRLCATCARNW